MKLAVSESKLIAAEEEISNLKTQLMAFTAVERVDVDTGEAEIVHATHEEALVSIRKRDASTALGHLAEVTDLVVRVQKEKVDIAEDLQDKDELAMYQALHSDRLMSRIEALEARVKSLGATPVPMPQSAGKIVGL